MAIDCEAFTDDINMLCYGAGEKTQTDRRTGRETERHRQTNRETGRQRDRETQAGRQTDRQTKQSKAHPLSGPTLPLSCGLC